MTHGRKEHLSDFGVFKTAIKYNVAILGTEMDALVEKYCTKSLK